MKILLVYSSKYGTTAECAYLLKEKLDGNIDIVNINDEKPVLAGYDSVIIGSSVYMGSLNRKITSFCVNNLPSMIDMKIGFFICHMDFDIPAEKQIAKFYPNKLVDISTACKGFGGAYMVSKMNFFYKWIIKKSAGIEEDTKNILYDEIDAFASEFNK